MGGHDDVPLVGVSQWQRRKEPSSKNTPADRGATEGIGNPRRCGYLDGVDHVSRDTYGKELPGGGMGKDRQQARLRIAFHN